MKKQFFEVQQMKMDVADKTAPPLLMPSVDESFFPKIGKLIVRFGLMEQELNILTWALTTHNNTHEPGWQQRQFEKRFALLQSEWSKFTKQNPSLNKLLTPTFSKIRQAKVLRDSFAHKEMSFGAMAGRGQFVQFFNKNRAKQKSKRYFENDLSEASSAAQNAAGEMYWLTDQTYNWPVSSHDKSLLRSLPNTDHLRVPR